MPIVVLHAAMLGYLVTRRGKSRPTRLFIGWMICLLSLMACQGLARLVYAPPGGYLDCAGSTAFSWLGLLLALQFVYAFPRAVYAREARLVLAVTAALGGVLLVMMGWELTRLFTVLVYNFTQYEFWLGPFATPGWIISNDLMYILQPLGYLWGLGVWLRKTVASAGGGPVAAPRSILAALWRPQTREARATRDFALIFAVVPLVTLVPTLESSGMLPTGSFAAVYMVSMLALVVTYTNHSAEPATLMVKLVGITLVAVLVILELMNGFVLDAYVQADERVRQAEMTSVDTAIALGRQADIPAEVQYVAARPAAGGLFSAQYQVLFARTGAAGAPPTAEALAAEDARLQERLRQGQLEAWVAHPWLGSFPNAGQALSAGEPRFLAIPPGARSYRGAYATLPAEHYIRYTIPAPDGNTLYEVGYSYLQYRQDLHRAALPLIYVTLGMSLLVLLVFPLLFRAGVAQPLGALLAGVERVNAGDLGVSIPVRTEDEIGFLAGSFNRMVRSLHASRAEAQALNATLEARVLDRTRELSALYEVSAVASRAVGLETMLAASLERTLAAVPCVYGAILLQEAPATADDLPGLRLAAAQGLSPEPALPAAGGPAAWVLERCESLLIANTATDGRWRDALSPLAPAALLVTPMRAAGQVIGVFVLGRAAGQGFALQEVTLAASIADQVGLAVHNDRLRQQAILLEERQRLARDLHDSVSQSLYGLVTLTEAGQAQMDGAAPAGAAGSQALRHTLARIGQTARQALKEIRLYLYELRPPVLEQEGLAAALQLRLTAVEGRSNVHARLMADESIQLPGGVANALYQIAQEALNNILRHTQAASVTVALFRRGAQVVLEIADDGAGFDPASVAQGMGLANMRLRARQAGGKLEIDSAPGRGTRIRARVPVQEAQHA